MARTDATETRETMAALRARVKALEDELERLQNPVVRFEVDQNRRILDANEALARLVGRSVAQLKRCRVYTVLSKQESTVDIVIDHFFKGIPFPGSAKLFMAMHIEGTDRHVQFSVRPKRDRRGTIRTLLFTGQDVTLEFFSGRIEELRRHGEFLLLALDQTGLGCVHAYNVGGTRFLSSVLMAGVSNGIADALGYTMAPDRPAISYYRYKPDLYLQPVSRLFTRATIRALGARVKTGSEDHVEGEIIARDGSTRPARLSITAGRGVRGRTAFTILVEDRSEHERALQRLTERAVESEEKFRTLFENASDPIFLEDLDGNILDCNKSACRLYGYSRNEMCGLHAQALLSGETTKALRAFRERIRREGRASAEAQNKRRDGSLFDVEVSASVIEIGSRSSTSPAAISPRARSSSARSGSRRRSTGAYSRQPTTRSSSWTATSRCSIATGGHARPTATAATNLSAHKSPISSAKRLRAGCRHCSRGLRRTAASSSRSRAAPETEESSMPRRARMPSRWAGSRVSWLCAAT